MNLDSPFFKSKTDLIVSQRPEVIWGLAERNDGKVDEDFCRVEARNEFGYSCFDSGVLLCISFGPIRRVAATREYADAGRISSSSRSVVRPSLPVCQQCCPPCRSRRQGRSVQRGSRQPPENRHGIHRIHWKLLGGLVPSFGNDTETFSALAPVVGKDGQVPQRRLSYVVRPHPRCN